MTNNYFQSHLIIKLLYLTGDYLKKNTHKKTSIETYLQEFKLKLLLSENRIDLELLNVYLNQLIKKDLDTLLVLKFLYTLNFKDSLDQQYSNRTLVNIIKYTGSNINTYLKYNDVEQSETDPYLNTVLIQNLYFFYKIYHQLNIEKNE